MDGFEVYYAYLDWCEKDNWANMRDPNHDYMEWNHTLPRCIFKGHGPGQWLTMEQHAVASVLQTLAFNRQCYCGWHQKYVPETLWSLAILSVSDEIRAHAKKGASKGGKAGKGKPKKNTPETRKDMARRVEKARACRTSEGLARGGRVAGKKNGKLAMSYRFQCTVTGFISTAPALTRYQKARGIDPSNRIKIN
jgi:hypothetical protein